MPYVKKLRYACSIILCLPLLIAVATAQAPAVIEDLKLETGRGETDGFASGLSVYGDIAVIGAWLDDEVAFGAGAAYVYERPEGGQTSGGRSLSSPLMMV